MPNLNHCANLNFLGGSGAWLLSNCEGFTANKAASGSGNGQGGDGYTAQYRHFAHFGILFDVTIYTQVNITGKRIVNESDTLELNCTFTRSATLSWFKRVDTSSLKRIVLTSRISLQRDIEGSSMIYSVLVIRDVVLSDNGIYVCEAQSGGISFSVNYTIHIHGISNYVLLH